MNDSSPITPSYSQPHQGRSPVPSTRPAYGLMSTGDTDEILIKKRRRRTAVDPCLGYYGSDFSGENAGRLDMREAALGGPQDVQKDAVFESSDSAQIITSPRSEDDAVVTVDDFLRRQALPSIRGNRKTYSRKRRRMIQSSSDELAGGNDDRHSPGHTSDLGPPGPLPSKSCKMAQAKTRKQNLRSRGPGTWSGVAFSKRIQRAATMSHVETDTCRPLSLAPSNDKLLPRSPEHDRRVRLVNPCIPRRLDTSFANKENTPQKTKLFRPFMDWCSPSFHLSAPLPSPPLTGISARATTCRTTRPLISPLKLVPYEEHREAQSTFCNQNVSRMERRGVPPLLLETNHSVSASQCNSEADPFMSLPFENGPSFSARPHASNSLVQDPEEDVNVPIDMDVPTSDPPGIPISSTQLKTSLSPSQGNPGAPANNFQDGSVLQDLQVTYGSSASDNPVSDPRDSPPSALSFPPAVSRKPLRSLSSMLNGLMETARGVLLSQSQTQKHAPGSQTEDAGRLVLPQERARRTSSRRFVASSPVRRLSRNVSKNLTPATSQRRTRSRKYVSMSSVSSFLQFQDDSSPDGRAKAITRTDNGSGGDTDTHIAAPDSIFFTRNAGYRTPNLFDLLADAEPDSLAQIILSPTD